MTTKRRLEALALLAVTAAITSCGGGGSSSQSVQPTDPKVKAAQDTATNNAQCAQTKLGDYYWEIGDASGVLVSGQVGSTMTAGTLKPIASASKWIYGAYVVQQRGGTVFDTDVPYLNFTSGYTTFTPGFCLKTDTVSECLTRNDAALDSATKDHFAYSSGHMEVHAGTFMGLESKDASGLDQSILAPIFGITPSDTSLNYLQPLLAGGVTTNATSYARFLRRILDGTLTMKGALGTHAVCANPSFNGCTTAHSSPLETSTTEGWNYSLGHWVEADPTVGDGAFSSAGAFGWYPWIDVSKTYYGLIARYSSPLNSDVSNDLQEGYVSARCGRLLRQAFITGKEVTTAEPTKY